jgi:hypothetical protein
MFRRPGDIKGGKNLKKVEKEGKGSDILKEEVISEKKKSVEEEVRKSFDFTNKDELNDALGEFRNKAKYMVSDVKSNPRSTDYTMKNLRDVLNEAYGIYNAGSQFKGDKKFVKKKVNEMKKWITKLEDLIASAPPIREKQTVELEKSNIVKDKDLKRRFSDASEGGFSGTYFDPDAPGNQGLSEEELKVSKNVMEDQSQKEGTISQLNKKELRRKKWRKRAEKVENVKDTVKGVVKNIWGDVKKKVGEITGAVQRRNIMFKNEGEIFPSVVDDKVYKTASYTVDKFKKDLSDVISKSKRPRVVVDVYYHKGRDKEAWDRVDYLERIMPDIIDINRVEINTKEIDASDKIGRERIGVKIIK